MRFNLPARVDLTCPLCKLAISLRSPLLHQQTQLICPFCRREFDVYAALPPRIRRKIYYTVRDEMEHRVYTKHKSFQPDYFDEWSASAGLAAAEDDSES